MKTKEQILNRRYFDMTRRVEGKARDAATSVGKPILAKEDFMEWSMYNVDFLLLFKRWKALGYPKELSPSIDRIDNDKGYTLDNMQWITWKANRLKR
jgi:hypothetical protein